MWTNQESGFLSQVSLHIEPLQGTRLPGEISAVLPFCPNVLNDHWSKAVTEERRGTPTINVETSDGSSHGHL